MMLARANPAALLLLAVPVAPGEGVVADKITSSPPTAVEPPRPLDDAQPKPAGNRLPNRRPKDGWVPGTTFAKLQATPFWVPFLGPNELTRASNSVRDGNFMRSLLYSPDCKRMTFVE